jgi:hypothetical protein
VAGRGKIAVLPPALYQTQKLAGIFRDVLQGRKGEDMNAGEMELEMGGAIREVSDVAAFEFFDNFWFPTSPAD